MFIDVFHIAITESIKFLHDGFLTLFTQNLYIVLFIVITHLLLCKAFVVYEAITFECSLASLLWAIMNVFHHGATLQNTILVIVFLFCFILNAFIQWLFYKQLQNTVKSTISSRNYSSQGLQENLQKVISASVVPSFSRFIEESKLLNNPGNFFGLVKKTMGRERFQKRKYLLREKSAELLNYCSNPNSNAMEEASLSVKPESLALKKWQEIVGLLSFDLLGFGAIIAIVCITMYTNIDSSIEVRYLENNFYILIISLMIILVSYLSSRLRYIAFNRSHCWGTELGNCLFFAILYFFSHQTMKTASWWEYLFTLLSIVIIIVLYLVGYMLARKKLQKGVKEAFSDAKIRIETNRKTETNHVKMICLDNLEFLSLSVFIPQIPTIVEHIRSWLQSKKIKHKFHDSKKKQKNKSTIQSRKLYRKNLISMAEAYSNLINQIIGDDPSVYISDINQDLSSDAITKESESVMSKKEASIWSSIQSTFNKEEQILNEKIAKKISGDTLQLIMSPPSNHSKNTRRSLKSSYEKLTPDERNHIIKMYNKYHHASTTKQLLAHKEAKWWVYLTIGLCLAALWFFSLSKDLIQSIPQLFHHISQFIIRCISQFIRWISVAYK